MSQRSTEGAYDAYSMTPTEHLQLAERHADWAQASDRLGDDSDQYRLAQAMLSLAHATIAQAQLYGALRV
jgi:hypothetical protein